ncbi:MAG: metallophosphoesterase family protein [Acidobacteriota bacterium]|jgi:predicted phosphodiesterase
MRVAALYDIHGNLPALEAVLDDVRRERVDQVVVGGDVFPGPMPGECLQYLLDLELPVRFIHGNGDRETLAAAAGGSSVHLPEPARAPIAWGAEQLEDRHRRIMEGWPPSLTLVVEGVGEVLFCHATPRNDTEIFTRETPDERLLGAFESAPGVVVCGHTHMQFDRSVGDRRVINAGSVGMPFGEPGAYWLLLGPDVALHHTDYDLVVAADRVRASGYPQADEFADGNVLSPPSAEQMLQAFEATAPVAGAADDH